jgi:enhancing lycopene biosynthesis protein 2
MALARATAALSKSLAGKRIAVVLSGCGVYDGSEIQESVFALRHIAARGGEYKCFALDKLQMHVVDHTKGEPMEPARNILVEASRISRGDIAPLSTLTPESVDAMIFPGGFGVAKNFSTYATKGADYDVSPEIKELISKFHNAGKPMGFCCIAPVLPAKVLPGCEVTVGSDVDEPEGTWPYAGTAGAIDSVGGKHVKKKLSEAHVDSKYKVVTSPAYMCNAPIIEIDESVEVMVEGVADLIK